MKKIALVLVVLLAISGVAFAEVGISGTLNLGVTNVGTPDVASNVGNAEIDLKAMVDDYTTVAIQLDSEGSDWTSTAIDLEQWKVTTDVLGALGVEGVSLKITGGLFKAFYTNWNYVSRSGEEFYGPALAGAYLWSTLTKPEFAIGADLGYEGYSLKYWQDMDGESMTVAVSGAPVDGLNFLVGYHSTFKYLAEGSLWLDAGYSFEAGPAALTIPVAFVMDLSADSDNLGWSSGVAADVDAFHFALGLGGSGAEMFQNLNFEVSTSMVENADIYVIADCDFTTDDTLQSVDMGGTYMFGALQLGAGYVVALDDSYTTYLSSDSWSTTGSGLYLNCKVAF